MAKKTAVSTKSRKESLRLPFRQTRSVQWEWKMFSLIFSPDSAHTRELLEKKKEKRSGKNNNMWNDAHDALCLIGIFAASRRERKKEEKLMKYLSCTPLTKLFSAFHSFYSLFFSVDVELLFCCFFSTLDVVEELSKIPKIIHPIPQMPRIFLLLDPLLNRVCSYTQFVSTALTTSSTDDRRCC